MKFAKVVFVCAGIWGIGVLTPLYWLVDVSGRRYGVPTEYPQFYYGFLSVAMAWQIAFLIIGSNPARFRMLMIPGILEKLGSRAPCGAVQAGSGHLGRRAGGRAGFRAGDPDDAGVCEDAVVYDLHLEHHERQKIVRAVNDDRRP